MKKEKAQLGRLASQIKTDKPESEKANFHKLTFTMNRETYELLAGESLRRKLAREENHLMADILREAIRAHLGKKA